MDEVGSSQDFVDNALVNAAFGTHSSILIILQFPIGEVPHCSIDENISWTSIEVVATLDIPFREDTEVGNATDVLDSTVQGGVIEK